SFLLLCAVVHEHLAGDAVVGAEHRTERGRRVAELEGELHLLVHAETQSAVLLGEREAEEPHCCRLPAQLIGDRVELLDLLLPRNHLLADELAHGLEDVGEFVALHGDPFAWRRTYRSVGAGRSRFYEEGPGTDGPGAL